MFGREKGGVVIRVILIENGGRGGVFVVDAGSKRRYRAACGGTKPGTRGRGVRAMGKEAPERLYVAKPLEVGWSASRVIGRLVSCYG